MTPFASKLEQALFAGLLATLAWAPLPFASNRPWGAMLLTALVAVLLAGWAVAYAAGKTRMDTRLWRSVRWPLVLLCLVQAWVFLQTIDLPRGLLAALSPQADAWHIRQGSAPISLDTAATVNYLLRGLAITGGFFLTAALVNTPARVRLFLQVLVFSGVFQAVYGAVMVLSGWEIGFFVQKYASQGSASGTFVNRNHFAGYLVMCLAAGTGLLLAQMRPGEASTVRERLRELLRLLLSEKMRVRIYLAVMVVALVLSRSRMGNVAFFSSLAGAGALYLWAEGRFSWRILLFLGSLFLVDALIIGQWFGLDQVLERLNEEQVSSDGRVNYIGGWLAYLQAFPLTGSGGGSFYGIFPNFQPPEVQGFAEHAHNDYVEFATELGIPAAMLLGAFLLASAWQAWKVLQERRRKLFRGAAFAVLMCTVWVLLHSLVDFNMQIPANALTLSAILALAWVCRYIHRTEKKPTKIATGGAS